LVASEVGGLLDGLRHALAMPRARKIHKVGFETEYLVLEADGSVSVRADELISRTRLPDAGCSLHHDYTHNMIELTSPAGPRVRPVARSWLEAMARVLDEAAHLGLRVYPYGTYIGTHAPAARTDARYRMQEDVLGAERLRDSGGRCLGFHLHYCLPHGTFGREARTLRQLFRSQGRDQLLSLYNILLACDPAVTNLMESSPFIDGTHMAKDSRAFLYRAMRLGRGAGALRGLYYDLPALGRLPRYANAISDLILLGEQRQRLWRELVEERNPAHLELADSLHPLQFNWSPLRINRIGTLEYRGLDSNLPSHIIGTSVLLKYLLRQVQEEGLKVVPSDIGIREPFKREGECLHVPPFSYLDEVLQFKSALKGLADAEVLRYTRRFAALALQTVPSKRDPGLERVRRIVQERRTKSDEILARARRMGWDGESRLGEETARALALEACGEFESEVRRMVSMELAIDLEEAQG
jgi:carboxylate-amine ligase